MEKFKTAVILAGGKSSRMGFDKQFLKINEKRLIDIMINKLKKEFEDIIIVTNKPEQYTGSYKIVCDEIKGKGPMGGIHIGLKESSSKYAYFVACDMPNINIGYIKHMKEMIKDLDVDACITKIENKAEHLNAFYSRDVISDIENLFLEDRRAIVNLTNQVSTLYIEEKDARKYSPNWEMFLNINTKEELSNYINSLDD